MMYQFSTLEYFCKVNFTIFSVIYLNIKLSFNSILRSRQITFSLANLVEKSFLNKNSNKIKFRREFKIIFKFLT